MTPLEAGLRGGAIAVLLLLAFFGWRDARHAAVTRYGILFLLCGAAYLVESAPGLSSSQTVWVVSLRLLSMSTPGVFLLWAAANFDDSFTPSWTSWLPAAAMVALSTWAVVSDRAVAWRVTQAAALVLVAIGIWQVLGGRAADLVEGRRRFRLVLAIGAGLAIAGFTILGAIHDPAIRVQGSAISAGIVLALAMTSAMFRLGVRQRPELAAAPASGVPLRDLTVVAEPEERAILDRLRHLIEAERIYREEGLSIAVLAARLGLPEYRLRRLINQRLGHRNFNSFINGYRLAETIAALADPDQAQVPVLTIALDAGFQSIGPFNRAFKAQTGMTPTDFRRDRLDRAASRAAE
jgi:AraC-like DNA-binding protein